MSDAKLNLGSPTLETLFEEVAGTLKFCNEKYYAFPAAIVACSTMNAIGSFLLIDPDKPAKYPPNDQRFKECVKRYFSHKYHNVANQLWESLRCALSHVLTVGPDVAVSCRNDRRHLHLQEVNGYLFVSMLELAEDLHEAMKAYLQDLRADSEVRLKFEQRLKKEANAVQG